MWFIDNDKSIPHLKQNTTIEGTLQALQYIRPDANVLSYIFYFQMYFDTKRILCIANISLNHFFTIMIKANEIKVVQ